MLRGGGNDNSEFVERGQSLEYLKFGGGGMGFIKKRKIEFQIGGLHCRWGGGSKNLL